MYEPPCPEPDAEVGRMATDCFLGEKYKLEALRSLEIRIFSRECVRGLCFAQSYYTEYTICNLLAH